MKALRTLEKFNKDDVQGIYRVIGRFFQGVKSMEVYAEANQSQTISMFHQILHFLAFKDNLHYGDDWKTLVRNEPAQQEEVETTGGSENEQMKQVRYECIKNELKRSYQTRANLLSRKMAKVAETDMSYKLLSNITNQDEN